MVRTEQYEYATPYYLLYSRLSFLDVQRKKNKNKHSDGSKAEEIKKGKKVNQLLHDGILEDIEMGLSRASIMARHSIS